MPDPDPRPSTIPATDVLHSGRRQQTVEWRPSVTFDIRRGSLFESAALDYNQYRPGYPVAIVNEAISLCGLRSSSRLLEIGCGTGNATVSFAAHGYMMDCIDPGRRLIGFARRRCREWPHIALHTGRFEDLSFDRESYDMVLSAQSFHWIDPEGRLERIARVLRKGGSLVLLQNYPGKDVDPTIAVVAAAIEKASRGAMKSWDYVVDLAGLRNEIEDSGLFSGTTIVKHRWTQRYSAASYAGLFRTYSDYLSLPLKAQQEISRRIREIVSEHGGFVTRSYDSILLHTIKG
jgi:ubiquinone/menaquinone biosynthesis C-methylase UbiE